MRLIDCTRARLSFVLLVFAVGLGTSLTPVAGQHGAAGSDTVIVLKDDFIEKYKNLVTIQADLQVDVAGPVHKISKGGKDGDMHFSGRDPAIGLPIVAEIMNAKQWKKAVRTVKDAEGGDMLKIKGAWRLWCEHANNTKQD